MEMLSIEAFYLAGAKNRLLGLRCVNGHLTSPPRHSCSKCESSDFTVVELSGNGKVLSNTEVYVKSQEFPLDTPFNLALVELDEGPRLLGVLESKSASTGTRVKVLFRVDEREGKASKWPRIFFQPMN